MGRSARAFAVAMLVVLGLLAAVPHADAISVTGGNVFLGKVPLGFSGTYTREVANSDAETVHVEATVECGCPVYVTVEPVAFTLEPGAKEVVTIRVEVPQDAGPGIHSNTVRFTGRAPQGGGNVATGAGSVNVEFYPVTARLYADVLANEVAARFISGLDANVSVTVAGTLRGHGLEHALGPETDEAAWSARASTTRFSFPLPFATNDPDGAYDVALTAEWTNATAGLSGSSNLTLRVLRGPVVQLAGLAATATPDGIRLRATLDNLADVPIEAWAVFTVTGAGSSGEATTGHILLDGQAGAAVEALFETTAHGTFTVRGHAAYRSADGQTGFSADTEPVTVERAPAGGGGGAGSDDGGVARLAVVALVGIGVGAVVAIAVNRRKPKA